MKKAISEKNLVVQNKNKIFIFILFKMFAGQQVKREFGHFYMNMFAFGSKVIVSQK